ncbi:MAG: trypsin-like peptidase domain-containing protein [Gemmatimonadota bacterium]|nr:MAG: trypsin-like peptidase domain-containing protein [Gemmatimonadota bacterium]
MSDPVRSKLRFVLYTSLTLALGLALAAGFRWARGGEAASPATASTALRPATSVATLPEVTVEPGASTQQPTSDAETLSRLAEVSRAFVDIAQTVTPAVVSVSTRGNPQRARLPQRFEELFGPTHPDLDTPFDVPLGRGSGFIVSEDGYIITNNHVVANAERIEVELTDSREYVAQLVGRDPTTDIAVLKIDGRDFPAAKIGDSEAAAVGEFVLAIGNPGSSLGSELPFTVTAGIISAKGRRLGLIQQVAGTGYAIEDLIQTDAVINPGNSGGPLVNYRGEVIGVNTAIQSTTGYYQGYGFAIPISLARDVMEDLVEHGRVRRAALRVNVEEVTAAHARAFRLPEPHGAVVQDFPDDSPAERAGIERGDVIVALDGQAVERVGQLQRLIASYEPGDRVKVNVIRYGEELSFDVRLVEAELPEVEPVPTEVAAGPGDALIGVQVADMTPSLAGRAGFDPDVDLEGVLVTRVANFGPASEAGLTAGWLIQQVNGQPIRSEADFDRALSQVSRGDVVTLHAVAPSPIEGELTHRIINIEVPEE